MFLANDKALLQAIYDSSSVAIFLVNPEGRIVHANQRMAEMFGCTMEDLIGSEYVDLIHPSEREIGHQKMLSLLVRGLASVNLERRYLRRDGSQFWGHLTGTALRDAQGQTTGLVGNIADIDQRKRAEKELNASQERFERMARTIPCLLYDYIFVPGTGGRFLYVNSRCEEFFELSPGALLADMDLFWKLVHKDDLAHVQAVNAAANRDGGLFVCEFRIVTPSGKEKWIHASSRPNPVLPGEPVVWSGYMTDITQTKLLEAELRQLATTDAMTGLANRHYFLRQMELEMERFYRAPRNNGLLMLDLDHFKHINDGYGHAAGDQVLRDFAARIQRHLRSVDLFGRMGGEEFCIFLPDTDLAGATALAERLCQAVAREPARVEEASIAYTVSIGVSDFRPTDQSFAAILARSDKALYQAKNDGRNRVAAL